MLRGEDIIRTSRGTASSAHAASRIIGNAAGCPSARRIAEGPTATVVANPQNPSPNSVLMTLRPYAVALASRRVTCEVDCGSGGAFGGHLSRPLGLASTGLDCSAGRLPVSGPTATDILPGQRDPLSLIYATVKVTPKVIEVQSRILRA